jgi:hypothetical protein
VLSHSAKWGRLAAISAVVATALAAWLPPELPLSRPAFAVPPGAIAAELAARNRVAAADRNAFLADGWVLVEGVPPPEARLGDLDPSLMSQGRSAELRVQLASVSPSRRHAPALRTLALTATEPALRAAAIDALGRVKGDGGQAVLLELLVDERIPDDLGVAARLRPVDLDDELAAHMADLLGDERVSAVERKQLAFTLALVGERDGMTLPDPVLATLSPAARALLDETRALVARGLGERLHHHAPPVADDNLEVPAYLVESPRLIAEGEAP